MSLRSTHVENEKGKQLLDAAQEQVFDGGGKDGAEEGGDRSHILIRTTEGCAEDVVLRKE